MKAKEFFTKVVGVSHRNNDGSERQKIIAKCKPKEKILLVPDADNKYDKNAVKVCRTNGEQLGYLSADLASEISPLLKNKKVVVEAEVSDITGGGLFFKKTRGCNIKINYY